MARSKEEVMARDSLGRKHCPRCEVWKSEENYAKDNRNSDGLYTWCRSCRTDYTLERKATAGVPTRFGSKVAYTLWVEHPLLYSAYKSVIDAAARAKRTSREFTLYTRTHRGGPEVAARRVFDMMTEQFFLCPVFSTLYQSTLGTKACPQAPSLDRLDPNGGYTWDNVWVISFRANVIKSDATKEDLYAVADAAHAEMKRRTRGDNPSSRHRSGRFPGDSHDSMAAQHS